MTPPIFYQAVCHDEESPPRGRPACPATVPSRNERHHPFISPPFQKPLVHDHPAQMTVAVRNLLAQTSSHKDTLPPCQYKCLFIKTSREGATKASCHGVSVPWGKRGEQPDS